MFSSKVSPEKKEEIEEENTKDRLEYKVAKAMW